MTTLYKNCSVQGTQQYPDLFSGQNIWSGYGTFSGTSAGRNSTGTYHTTLIRILTPNFVGASISVNLGLKATQQSGGKTLVGLRCALCNSDANKNLYINTYSAVTDIYQVHQTAITATVSATESTTTISFPNTGYQPNTNYYIFIWAAFATNNEWLSVSSSGAQTSTVNFNGNVVKVYENGAWNNYQAYVCNGTGWDGYKPMVHNGSSWVEHG